MVFFHSKPSHFYQDSVSTNSHETMEAVQTVIDTHPKKKKKKLHVKSVIQHQCSSLWGKLFFVKIFNSRFSSVNGEAERAVHLLPNKPRVSGTRLDCGTCQDSVCGQNSLLCCSFGKLGFFQLPEKQEQIFFL